MIDSLHQLIIEIDNALFGTGLGDIPYSQTSDAGTEYIEVMVSNSNVKDYRTLLINEARRLNVPDPCTKTIFKGIDFGAGVSLPVTTFIYRVRECPQLLLLLESGLQNREQYAFMDIEEDANLYDSHCLST